MRKASSLLLLFLLFTQPVWGLKAVPKPQARRAKRHMHWPWHREKVVFPPSRDSLRAQNVLIDSLGLQRIADDRELSAVIERGELVPITTNSYVSLSPRLPTYRAYVRSFTDEALQQLGKEFYDQFSLPIQVNSAVRPITEQKKLRRWNPNAAPISGELSSSHMAGATVDLQRRGLTKKQILFLEWRLFVMMSRRPVIVEEEVVEPCFHIMVGPVRVIETEPSIITDQLIEPSDPQ